MKAAGFSLIELLVTLSLIALLAGLAAPGLVALKREHEYNRLNNQLRQALTLARHGAKHRAIWARIEVNDTARQLRVTGSDGTLWRQYPLPRRFHPVAGQRWDIDPQGLIHGPTTLVVNDEGERRLHLPLLPPSPPPRLAATP